MRAPIQTSSIFFFFNDTATTEIYTLSLHDALPISAFQQAEESGLMATLRVGILVDDEIRIGAYPDQARIGEDDEHLAVAAGMDLIARLDGGAAGEPQDLAAAEHERVAVRAQHFSGGFRQHGQSERSGAKCDAQHPQKTRRAHACVD